MNNEFENKFPVEGSERPIAPSPEKIIESEPTIPAQSVPTSSTMQPEAEMPQARPAAEMPWMRPATDIPHEAPQMRQYENNQTPPHGENIFHGNNPRPVTETKVPEFNVTHTVKKPKRTWPKLIAMSLVAGALFGAAFGVVSRIIPDKMLPVSKIAPTTVTVEEGDVDVSGLSEVSKIAEACMPSVVAITNHSVSDVITFFGSYQQESTSSGSGIIIGQNDSELLIVTNYHVVANSKELSVVFNSVEKRLEQPGGENEVSDKDIPNATIKGYDPNKDIAVIAVQLSAIPEYVLSEIKVATVGDSSTLKPGDQVVAIGNALGYGQSVTTGIISAVNRSISMENADGSSVVTNTFIQTDAAINAGNSGGALLDMAGNLIGINSVKIASTGVEGMGYAIPISEVMSIIDELMVRETRELVDEEERGVLGIMGTDVDSSDSEAFGMPVGVYVSEVTKGMAAEQAGIKNGYIITEFDGYTITTISQLQERLKYYHYGEKVNVTVMVREGEEYVEKEIELTLSRRSEDD